LKQVYSNLINVLNLSRHVTTSQTASTDGGFFLLFYKGSITTKKSKDLALWLRRFDTYGTTTELNNALLRTSVKIKISRLSKTVVMQFGASVIFSCL